MALIKPQTIVDANIYLDGVPHLGVSKEIKFPNIEFNKTTQKAGGFERNIFDGSFKPMESEITFRTFTKSGYKMAKKAYQSSDHSEVMIKASYYQNGKKYPIIAIWKGNANVEDKPLEAAGEVERTLKMDLVFAQLTIDGYEEYQIDSDNMIGIVDGTDLLADLRGQL
jgi:P2 family phage contractile tail tube protein